MSKKKSRAKDAEERMLKVDRLAQGVTGDPKREASAERYHRALLDAVVAIKDADGAQDFLELAEGHARLIATTYAGMPDGAIRGVLDYITLRAQSHIVSARVSGNFAQLFIEPEGHA